MGDCANITLHTEGQTINLYSHWHGAELPDLLAEAIEEGRDRWSDPEYFARIIFSRVIQDHESNSGWGLGVWAPGGGEDRVLHVDLDKQTVRFNDGSPLSYEEYLSLAHREW